MQIQYVNQILDVNLKSLCSNFLGLSVIIHRHLWLTGFNLDLLNILFASLKILQQAYNQEYNHKLPKRVSELSWTTRQKDVLGF